MRSNLLINVRYENISLVARDLRYHSAQRRIFLAGKGSYVFFISFNHRRKRHELVGYFVVERKGYRDSQWGKYTIWGKTGKFIKGLDFSKIRNKLSIKIGDTEGTPKSIGMATQAIRTLDTEDKDILLKYINSTA